MGRGRQPHGSRHQGFARAGDGGRRRHRAGDRARVRARGRQGAHLRCRRQGAGRRQEKRSRAHPVGVRCGRPRPGGAAVRRCPEALGGLDCLVNNAGIAGPTGKVEEINPEDWDRCLAIDITGQFNCVRLAVPHLKQSKNPSIMNLSSQAGKHGFPLRSAYAAAKWGVIGFTKSIAIELGGLRHPRQRAAAGPGGRRPHPPRHRGQGAAGRHLVQGEGSGAVRATSRSRTT